MAHFHAQVSVAPLKLLPLRRSGGKCPIEAPSPQSNRFHAQVNVALLKQARPIPTYGYCGVFPRSGERGPVEASPT